MGQSRLRQSSRGTTDYMRGVTILVVIISHYLLSYQNEFYQRYLFEYASVALAVFFILSGYGISKSFAGRTSQAGLKITVVTRFFFDRAFRIYPPYWLALASLSLFPAALMLREFNAGTVGIYLGSPDAFWFVTAIIQCYLAAPLLFLILRRFGLAVFAGLGILFFIASLFISYWLVVSGTAAQEGLLDGFMYCQYFLGNIVLFVFGMMIPELISRFGRRLNKVPLFLALLAVFLAAMHYGRFGIANYPLFAFGSLAFCTVMIATRPTLPFGRLIGTLGRSSYPLYLFHRIFFMLLVALGLISEKSNQSVVYTLLLFPLLVGFCVALEGGVTWAHNRVGGSLSFGKGGDEAGSAHALVGENQ